MHDNHMHSGETRQVQSEDYPHVWVLYARSNSRYGLGQPEG